MVFLKATCSKIAADEVQIKKAWVLNFFASFANTKIAEKKFYLYKYIKFK